MDSEIAAALLGALAAGGLQTIAGYITKKSETRSALAAVATEVASICDLIRAQQYLEVSIELQSAIGTAEWEASPCVVVIDIREDYFAVYNAMISKLGLFAPAQASAIVRFYQCCKSAIDSHRPDAVIPLEGDRNDKANHVRAAVVLFTAILDIGDLIVQFPRDPVRRFSLPLLRSEPQS